MKKILFISHEVSRTGAPIILLFLMRWLRQNHPDIEIHLLVLRPGVLGNEFKLHAHHYYEISENWNKKNIISRFKKKFKNRDSYNHDLIRKLSGMQFDTVFANTVVSVPWAARIKELDPEINLVAHIHELETAIELVLPDFDRYLKKIDIFIAVSTSVQFMLETKFLVQAESIHLVYEFIDDKSEPLKKFPQKEFIVGGSGTVSWRKGSDLFINVANHILKHTEIDNIKFQWVGGYSIPDKIRIDADLKKAGIQDKTEFLGELEDTSSVFSNFSVFLLPSREDPFPLVSIEVANYQVPIITFENASGTNEILQKGGGHIVPYLDTFEMANRIIEYYENPEILRKDGEVAGELFKEFRVANQCNKIFNILKNISPRP